MKEIFDRLGKFHKSIFLLVGLGIVLIGFLPALFLGEGAVYIFHDQLDGEIFSYILRARNLFGENRIYPELMNGIPKNGLQMAAPLFLALFFIFPPLWALFAGSVLIASAGFVGMFICVEEITENKFIALLSGIIFAYLPFYTVYGLCVMGVPLLLHAFYGLYRQKRIGRSLLLIAVYGLSSSLILVGFACLGMLGLAFVVLLCRQKSIKRLRWFLTGILLLTFVYLLCNYGLIGQVLGMTAGGYTSHKEEIIVQAVPVWDTLQELLTDGTMHAKGLQKYMLLPIIVAVIGSLLSWKRLESIERKAGICLLSMVFTNLFIALFCAFYKGQWMTDLRNTVGGVIKYMQFDRIYWLMPAFWHLSFGAALFLIWCFLKKKNVHMALILTGLCVCVSGAYIVWNSSFKSNVRQLVNPDTSNAMTWERFYNEELYGEIREYIGRPCEEYRVMSLGIDPAAALYNGFYCLDGYSNNYDVNYKHAFREIIAQEIAKSSFLQSYFDGWGNRCYLFAAELGGSYRIAKGSGIKLSDFSPNLASTKEMGCEYILSGVEIGNAEEIGLHLLQHFETPESYYEIWLYGLDELLSDETTKEVDR